MGTLNNAMQGMQQRQNTESTICNGSNTYMPEINHTYQMNDSNNNPGDDSDEEDVPDEQQIVRDKNYPKIYVLKTRHYQQNENTNQMENIKYNGRANRHACPYCRKSRDNIKRHLLGTHGHEPQIQTIKALDDTVKEQAEKKSQLLLLLAYKGDYLHNQRVLKNQSGQFLLRSRGVLRRNELDLSEFGPCKLCMVYCKVNSFDRHHQNCVGKKISLETVFPAPHGWNYPLHQNQIPVNGPQLNVPYQQGMSGNNSGSMTVSSNLSLNTMANMTNEPPTYRNTTNFQPVQNFQGQTVPSTPNVYPAQFHTNYNSMMGGNAMQAANGMYLRVI